MILTCIRAYRRFELIDRREQAIVINIRPQSAVLRPDLQGVVVVFRSIQVVGVQVLHRFCEILLKHYH